MVHWIPTGIEPTDYDDDNRCFHFSKAGFEEILNRPTLILFLQY